MTTDKDFGTGRPLEDRHKRDGRKQGNGRSLHLGEGCPPRTGHFMGADFVVFGHAVHENGEDGDKNERQNTREVEQRNI